MQILSNITSSIKTFVVGNKLLLVGIVAIVALFFVNKYNYNRYEAAKQEVKIAAANLKAANDTIHIIKTKDGTLDYQQLSYVVKSINDLKQVNSDLYTETQNLKGEILNIQKAQLIIHTDTSKLIVKSELIDSTVQLYSTYDTTYSKGNYHSLALFHYYDMKTHLSSGTILKDDIGFTAVTGLKKTADGYEIFLNPKYPGLKVEGLEGAIIDKSIFAPPESKKRSRFSFGGSVGWTPITYDFSTKQSSFSLTRIGATAGINFNF